MKRKAVIKYKATEKVSSVASVHHKLNKRAHRHSCTVRTCRLTFEDTCGDASRNGRCHSCLGVRRPWLMPDGRTSLDPHSCCVDNTKQLTDLSDLLRFECAGPGPWFQCLTCKRTHGHPCTDPQLLDRPMAVANLEGTP